MHTMIAIWQDAAPIVVCFLLAILFPYKWHKYTVRREIEEEIQLTESEGSDHDRSN